MHFKYKKKRFGITDARIRREYGKKRSARRYKAYWFFQLPPKARIVTRIRADKLRWRGMKRECVMFQEFRVPEDVFIEDAHCCESDDWEDDDGWE